MEKVISFNRDGTLQPWGGPITKEMLLKLKEEGSVIGTGGGAVGETQRKQWINRLGIEPDFALSKGELGKLKEMYPDAEYIHVDDAGVNIEGFRTLKPRDFVKEFGR